jgi:hypothetical protein
MSDQSVHVYVVRTPQGEKQYLTPLPTDVAFSRGLIREAIVGEAPRPLGPGEPVTPANFVPNPAFVRLMHDVLARHAPHDAACNAEAKRQESGWVYILDGRTKTPQGAVPPEDIIAALPVENGEFVPGAYRLNARHALLTNDGFFRLPPCLHEQLLIELRRRLDSRT